MIRNDKHGFLAQSQPFCLHSRSCHLKSLTGTYLVSQQRIAAVQHMSNGILLVFPQPNLCLLYTSISRIGFSIFLVLFARLLSKSPAS